MKVGIPYLAAPDCVDVEQYLADRFTPRRFGYRVLSVNVHQRVDSSRTALLEIHRLSGSGAYGGKVQFVRLDAGAGQPFPESDLEKAAAFYFRFIPLLFPTRAVVLAQGDRAAELVKTLSARIGVKELRLITSLREC